VRGHVLLWLAAAIGALIAGCGSSPEPPTAESRAEATRAAQAHKLRRLQRQLDLRRTQIREEHAKERRKDRPAPDPASNGSRDFTGLENQLPGEVGVTIGPPGESSALVAGSLVSGPAWSTIKVPISLAVLEDAGGPAGLSSSQSAAIRAALTVSDNEAAEALFAELAREHGGVSGAASAVGAVLRDAGDTTTVISTQGRDGFSPYGQTEWSLPLQHLFISRLAAGCVADPASRDYVLGLMGEVSSDLWGLGSIGLPVRWKGGWGPGIDGRYLVRQMGLVQVDGGEAVVTLAAIPTDGSFETAQSMASSLAEWLAEQAPRFTGPGRTGGC
jgi:hypothetical protein